MSEIYSVSKQNPVIETFSLDSVGDELQSLEALCRVAKAGALARIFLDVSKVGFVRPTGLMKLILAARHIAEQSGHPVRLLNLNSDLLAYLERVNLFEVAGQWLELDDILPVQPWDRNPQTANLLELTPITNASDVARVMERAEAIFSRWLQLPNLGSLLKVRWPRLSRQILEQR